MENRLRFRTVLILICIFFAASTQRVSAAELTEEPVKIAVSLPKPDESSSFHVLGTNLELLSELTPLEILYEKDTEYRTSSDSLIYSVEAFINDGADGILLCPSSDQILPTICRMCEDAGVYWGIFLRSIADEEIRNFCESSPYYIGNTCEDEETMGYVLTKTALQMGYRNFGLLLEEKWDTTFQGREKGIQKALEEYPDAEIAGEVRGMENLEDFRICTKALLDANPELDCIFVVGTVVSNAHEEIIEVLREKGEADTTGLITIDFTDHITENFQSGVLKAAYGLPQLSMDPYYLVIKMLNTLKGFPLSEESGTLTLTGILLENTDEAMALADVIEEDDFYIFSADYVRENLFKWNNPSLDDEMLQEIIDSNSDLSCSVKTEKEE